MNYIIGYLLGVITTLIFVRYMIKRSYKEGKHETESYQEMD